jgi:hypothetical protein
MGGTVSMEQLQEMYSSRVMMADFLSAKGIPVQCKTHPDAKLNGSDFSRAFQRVAAEQGLRTAFVRSATNNLLWDIQFLDDNLTKVKETIIADVKIELFGTSD